MSDSKKCPSCGASISLNATECKYCGEAVSAEPRVQNTYASNQNAQVQYQQQPQYQQAQPMYNNYPTNKSKVVAGVLGILLGGIGIHKFYLGRIGLGILYILFCWTYIPSIIGLIEGIIYLASSDENFYRKYVMK